MNWDDHAEIGAALAAAHPDVNHLTIGNAGLIRLVRALPGFDGPRTPPDADNLTAIGYSWIAILAGPDDSSPYEGVA